MDALEDDLNEKLTIDENLSKSIVVEWDQDFIYSFLFFLYTYVFVEKLTFIVFVFYLCKLWLFKQVYWSSKKNNC